MLPTSDKFRLDQLQRGDKTVVSFRGVIDEDTNFNPLLEQKGPLVINFKDVTGINSCGIRNWVNFLKECAGKEVSFEECPPVIVRQMNMVPSFIGEADVLSVYVPYVCEHCEHEKVVLVPKERFRQPVISIAETIPCDSCHKGEMEFDGHPQQYFAFRK